MGLLLLILALLLYVLGVMIYMGHGPQVWWRKWQDRRKCFHHDIGGNPANTRPAVSWIDQVLIDMGRRKMFWCTHCQKTWFT